MDEQALVLALGGALRARGVMLEGAIALARKSYSSFTG